MRGIVVLISCILLGTLSGYATGTACDPAQNLTLDVVARADLPSERIWRKLGAEHDASWLLDRPGGIGVGSCCINATLREARRIMPRRRWAHMANKSWSTA